MATAALTTAPGAVDEPLVRRASPGIIAFVVFALLFLSGEINRPLIGQDPTAGTGFDTSTPAIQALGIGIYALTTLLVVIKRCRISGLAIVLAVLCNLMALASAAWSPQPVTAIVRSLALAGSIPVAMLFATGLSENDRIRALRIFAYLFVITNLIAVMIPGGYGVHVAGVTRVYDEHAGRWRGFFFHKNALGEQDGVVILILVMSAVSLRIGQKIFHWAMMLGALAIMVFAGSAQLTAAVPFALGGYYAYRTVRSPTDRFVILTGFLVVCVICYMTGLFDALLGLLAEANGRDASLSSRTEVWTAVIPQAMPHAIIGLGYQTAWSPEVSAAVTEAIHADVGHPHNGYIKVWMELGFVGLGLILTTVGYCFSRAMTLRLEVTRVFPAFCVGFLIYFLLVNLVNSDLMEYNSLFWVLFLAGGLTFDNIVSDFKQSNTTSATIMLPSRTFRR